MSTQTPLEKAVARYNELQGRTLPKDEAIRGLFMLVADLLDVLIEMENRDG